MAFLSHFGADDGTFVAANSAKRHFIKIKRRSRFVAAPLPQKSLLDFWGPLFLKWLQFNIIMKKKAKTQKGFGFFLVRMMGLDKILLRKILMLCSTLGSF